MTRQQATDLLDQYVTSESLKRHCQMVAKAMEAYAKQLNQDETTWFLAGLLHDLDWEKYPDQHPSYALQNIFPNYDLDPEILSAIAAHAPDRTGIQPQTIIEKHLFACDEICGFLDAVAKVRPEGFKNMKWSSVNKKLKNKSFAANVSRDDILQGAALIEKTLSDHVNFLIAVFD